MSRMLVSTFPTAIFYSSWMLFVERPKL